MTVAARTCGECGERYWNTGAHAERCRGPRITPQSEIQAESMGLSLRQPDYEPCDWAGFMADQDAADRRVAPYLTNRDTGDEA